jgi:electron transport complex protein RnfA
MAAMLGAIVAKTGPSILEAAMRDYLFILLGTALVNNVVLARFLGLCPFMGVSNKVDSALGMGMATTFVLTLSVAVCWLVERYVLIPLDIAFLRILAFILVIAALVQFTEMFVRKASPTLYQALGIYLPLITTNCAVFGMALLNVQQPHNFLQSLLFGFGSALGFTLVMVLFAGLRERLALAEVPETFAGAPIGFIVAGLLALAFMGFVGLPVK